jgi:hypothetical protein
MAETTRTTSSGTSHATSSAPSASGASAAANPTSSGGARAASSPSSSNSANPAAATSGSPTSTSAASSRPSAATGGANQGPQPQNQTQGPQSKEQQNPGQKRQGRQGRQGGERDDEAYHVDLTGDPMADARKVGSELVGAARDSAVSLFDAQRARVAEQITALGDALRQSTGSLESTGVEALAQYANQAADRIAGFADTVRDRSWEELAGDLESFARRYPLTFMVSAMGVGFVLGRFLLSSSPRRPAGQDGTRRHDSNSRSDTRRDNGALHRPMAAGLRAEYGGSVRE